MREKRFVCPKRSNLVRSFARKIYRLLGFGVKCTLRASGAAGAEADVRACMRALVGAEIALSFCPRQVCVIGWSDTDIYGYNVWV